MICLSMMALVNTPVIQTELTDKQSNEETKVSTPTVETKKKLPDIESLSEAESVEQVSTVESPNRTSSEAKSVETVDYPENVESVTAVDAEKAIEEASEKSHSDDSASTLLSDESVSEAASKLASTTQLSTESQESKEIESSAMSDADWVRLYDTVASDQDGDVSDEPLVDDSFEMNWEPLSAEQNGKISLSSLNQERWIELTKSLELSGLAGELLLNSQWLATEGNTIRLKIFLKNLDSLAVKSTLTTVLTEYFSQVVKLDFETGETGDATARAQLIKQQQERQEQAEAIVANDPYIKSLKENFGAIVIDGSVRVLSTE